MFFSFLDICVLTRDVYAITIVFRYEDSVLTSECLIHLVSLL
jgi:hypothetical protein